MPRAIEIFDGAPLTVAGLHSVFENHEAMRDEALEAFLREQQVCFPVGVDAPDATGGTVPQTMKAYDMQGTPTMVLIDAFGTLDDLALGAELQTLLLEAPGPARSVTSAGDAQGCPLPRAR